MAAYPNDWLQKRYDYPGASPESGRHFQNNQQVGIECNFPVGIEDDMKMNKQPQNAVLIVVDVQNGFSILPQKKPILSKAQSNQAVLLCLLGILSAQ
jgi:hypothetical protein